MNKKLIFWIVWPLATGAIAGASVLLQRAYQAHATPASPVPVAVDTQPMSMGYGLVQLRERLNTIAAQRKLPYQIADLSTKKSSEVADQWVYPLSKHVTLMAMTNRSDGTVRSITYIGSGDGTLKSGADMMFALGVLLRTVDPSMNDETANELMMELISPIRDKRDVERQRNGLRFGSTLVPGVGLVAAINPSV
ncbi:MAG: hypothetical protein KF796_19255 [Ramlibacter sp.]|nr:hypothetical protein [Ramlibacter sp.]